MYYYFATYMFITFKQTADASGKDRNTEEKKKNQLTEFHLATAGPMHESFCVTKAYKLFEEALYCGTTLTALDIWRPYDILELRLQNENINL